MGYDAYLMIKGIRKPDDEWKKMKAVWDACAAAEVDLPDVVGEYFGSEGPSPEGVCVDIEKVAVTDGDETMTTGTRNGKEGNYYLVALKSIPDNVTHLKIWIRESY